MSDQEMGEKRRNAIRLMKSLGWTHRRKKHMHEFTRPDVGGLHDLARVSHKNLSLEWAITHCDDLELGDRIHRVRQEWVAEALARPGPPEADE